MENTSLGKFCVYAADSHEAYIAKLEEKVILHDAVYFKPVRYYEIDRNALVEDKRPLAEQALINARFVKHFAPDLSSFLLSWAEKDFPEREDEARKDLKKAEEKAKKPLYVLYKEAKRALKENPKKPYKPRIKMSKEYLYPNYHRTGRVFFNTLDDALDALYNAWKDLNKDWDEPGELKEMFGRE